MQKLRLAAVAAMTCCAVMLIGAATASAQERAALTQKVDVTGKNEGKNFTGTYEIQRFTSIAGKVVAVGRLTGTLKGRRVSRNNVLMPATLTQAPAAQGSQVLPPAPQPLPVASCPVLHLDLGPIRLNLLGLVVRTNRIFLFIDAIPSSEPGGGLLGDILCALSTLVPPPASSGQAAQALSGIAALSPRT